MGITAEIALAAANKYTDETVAGAGALKGAPCEIQSITRNQADNANVVTFKWENGSAETQTSAMTVPDGATGPQGPRGYAGESDFVTPEQFGAVGDGVTDDYTAFMAAYSEALSTNKTLKLTKKYLLGTKVSLNNYTAERVTIEGSAVKASQQHTGDYSIIIAPEGFEVMSYIRMKNVGIHDYGITVLGVRDSFEGCVFENCTTALNMAGGYGTHQSSWYGEIDIIGCEFANCTTGIDFVRDSTSNQTYKDCRIIDCIVMYGTTFINGRTSGYMIIGNHIYSTNPINGILGNGIIENNYFDTNDIAVNIGISGTNTVSVNGNMFYKSTTTYDSGDNPKPVCVFYGEKGSTAMFNNNFCSKALDESVPNEVFVSVTNKASIQYAGNISKIKFIELGTNAKKIPSESSLIPNAPSTDGTYTLQATVSNGVATFSWV